MSMHARFTASALVLPVALASPAGAGDDASAEAPPTRERGRALLDGGDAAGAEAVFAALVAKDETDGPSWFFLGFARHARKDYRGALAAHAKAATFPRLRGPALYNATCSHALLGDVDAALESLRGAVAAGWRNRGHLADDADVARLRADPRLPSVLRPLLRGADAFVEPVRVLHEFAGEAPGDEFGWVARAVGDLDGDGVSEFAATSPGHSGGAGRVDVFSARSGKLLFASAGERGDRFGNSVAPVGDVDGDGVGDLVVGAVQAEGRPGAAVLVSGKTGAAIRRIDGDAPGDGFGLKVCGLEDLDGDGRPDVAVSAWRADGPLGDAADAGAVAVHSGRSGDLLLRLRGERAGDRFGSAVAAVRHGDLRLLAVGAMDAGPGRRGRVQVFRLTAKEAVPHFVVDAAPTGADLGQYFVSFLGDCDGDGAPDLFASDFNDAAKGPATGRVLVRSGRDGAPLLDLAGPGPGQGFGTSYSVCGDADGDGRADLVVGAWQCGDAAPSGGRCTVLSGRDGRVLATYTSRMDGDTLGFDAAGLGDVDGDGGPDYLLSAAWSEVRGVGTGRVFVVAGPSLGAGSKAPPPSSR